MIEINTDELAKAEELLQGLPGAAKKAARTAISKSIRGAKKDATDKVKERYTIKPSYVTRTIKTKLIPNGAVMTSKGPVNDLAYFKHSPGSVLKKRPAPGNYLYSQVVKGEGGTIAHAFLAKMKSGHIGVFQRAGHGSSSASLPIDKLSGPSTPQMLESKTVSEYIEDRMKERLGVNIEHEINAFLMGYRT